MKNPCPHNRIQEFTECCLDCGRNVYETEEEYTKAMLEEMAEDAAEKERKRKEELAELEKLNAQLAKEGERLKKELVAAKKETDEAKKKYEDAKKAAKEKK